MKTYFSEEIDKKLLEAQSVEDVLAIANENSSSPVSEEFAEKIFAKVKTIRGGDAELDLDELESVSGGKGITVDFIKDGCHATVEPGSSCWSDDKCSHDEVVYDNYGDSVNCPYGGQHEWVVKDTFGSYGQKVGEETRCSKCLQKKF